MKYINLNIYHNEIDGITSEVIIDNKTKDSVDLSLEEKLILIDGLVKTLNNISNDINKVHERQIKELSNIGNVKYNINPFSTGNNLF